MSRTVDFKQSLEFLRPYIIHMSSAFFRLIGLFSIKLTLQFLFKSSKRRLTVIMATTKSIASHMP